MSTSHIAGLILYNIGAIIRFDCGPPANAVAIANGHILRLGDYDSIKALGGPGTRFLDCQGYTLAPGFIDSHCHLLGLASNELSVDCRPSKVSSIEDIQAAFRAIANSTPVRNWIRGYGYDEFYLKEKRQPNRWDLDQAVQNLPVKLSHRSGHATVLNSAALASVGINTRSEEPTGTVIERDLATGEPNGVLLEMEPYLETLIPTIGYAELEKGLRTVNKRLLSYGITSVQDATFTNSISRWQTFSDVKAKGVLTPRITVMPGINSLEDFIKRGLIFGYGSSDLKIGHAKVMLTRTTGTTHPPLDDLMHLSVKAQKAGFPIAIHAVESEAVDTAIEIIMHLRAVESSQALRHRIEHCSECPPKAIRGLQQAKALVVTQPASLFYNGQRYLSEVPPHIQPHLYPLASLINSGIIVATGSDAPVIPENPMKGISSAVTRQTASGEVISKKQNVPVIDALKMYTLYGAYSEAQENYKGSIEEGKLADLILLSRNPLTVSAEELGDLKIKLTIVGGQVVWKGY